MPGEFKIKIGLCSNEEILLFDEWAQLANLARPHQILVTSVIRNKIPESSPFKVNELPAVRINVSLISGMGIPVERIRKAQFGFTNRR